SSTMIGTLNPNSLILAATLSTTSSLINLGLFSYSFNSYILIFVIFITSLSILLLSPSITPSFILTTSITRFVVIYESNTIHILIFVIFINSPPINSLSTSNTPSIIPTKCITRFVVNDAFQAIKIATPYKGVALISYIILFDTTNYSLYFVDFKYVPSVILIIGRGHPRLPIPLFV